MPLTPKQEAFVREYLIDLNATQAAIRAAYSAKTAKEQGARLLTNVHVSAAVGVAIKNRSDRTEISADRVLKELAKIGFADIRKAVKWRTEEVIEDVEEHLEPQPHGGALKRSNVLASNIVELVSSEDIDDDTAAAISEISQTTTGGLRIKMHDKKAALVDLGRHLGLFADKVQITGQDGGAIEHSHVHEIIHRIVDPKQG